MPNTHNLVKKSNFTMNFTEIKKMCNIYMFSTYRHSFYQRDNKIYTDQ